MGFWDGIALFILVYLLLLARSAWKQGEMRQFLVSLLIVLAMITVIAAIVGGAIMASG